MGPHRLQRQAVTTVIPAKGRAGAGRRSSAWEASRRVVCCISICILLHLSVFYLFLSVFYLYFYEYFIFYLYFICILFLSVFHLYFTCILFVFYLYFICILFTFLFLIICASGFLWGSSGNRKFPALGGA